MDRIQFINTGIETDVAEITPELAKHLLASTNARYTRARQNAQHRAKK